MDGEEDWMMRPIKAGMLPMLAMKDPSYDLEDFLLCCESLDVDVENAQRLKRKTGR